MIPLKILLYDSGIGGINLLINLKKHFDYLDFYYMSDSKNFPYGTKNRLELKNIAVNNLDLINVNQFDAVILACNTLTTSCLSELKEIYPKVSFCGVEPISVIDENKKTLIVCTSRTKENILKNLTCDLVDVVAVDALVKEIEKNIFQLNRVDIKKHFKNVKRDYEKIILGCTHFCCLKTEFSRLFYSAEIDDGFMPINRWLKNYITTFDHNCSQKDFLPDFLTSPLETKFIFADKKRNFDVYKKLILR